MRRLLSFLSVFACGLLLGWYFFRAPLYAAPENVEIWPPHLDKQPQPPEQLRVRRIMQGENVTEVSSEEPESLHVSTSSPRIWKIVFVDKSGQRTVYISE